MARAFGYFGGRATLCIALAVLVGSSGQYAWAQGRSSRAHKQLTEGVGYLRQGEYELAAGFFQQAQDGADDLSPDEQKELAADIKVVEEALKQRREGAEKVHQAEEAVKNNHTQDALNLLKEVMANSYLTPADQQKARLLTEQLQPHTGGSPVASDLKSAATLSQARAKLRQARDLLAKGNYAGADALAAEADSLHATYTTGEDTPGKVRADILVAQKGKLDEHGLLTAARAALDKGDLDKAEQLANDAAKVESNWSLHLWSDSPSKVLKDVKEARAKVVVSKATTPTTVAQAPTTKPGDPAKPTDTTSGTKPKETTTVSTTKPATPDASAARTEAARVLLRDGRTALANKNYTEAERLAKEAQSKNPDFLFNEDTPERLLADIRKAAPAATVAVKPTTPEKPTTTASTDKPADLKADPRALLKQARALFNQGKLDEAKELAEKANASSSTHWGLFADSPDVLLNDIAKVKLKKDQDESARVLAEARKEFEQGNYDEAEKKAYRAEKLHGTYSYWELGDRPNKLLAEIDTARAHNRKIKLPDAPTDAVVKNEPKEGPKMAKPGGDGTAPAPKPVDVAVKPADLKPLASTTPPAPVVTAPPAPTPTAPPAPVVVQTQTDNTSPLARGGAQIEVTIPPAPVVTTPPTVAQAPPAPVVTTPPAPVTPPTVVQVTTPAPTVPVVAAPTKTTAELTKEKAQQLVIAARTLQARGELIEARQKALEAQKLGAAFLADEDSPERALIELAALCSRRIDALLQEATDDGAAAPNDPTRFPKAESKLTTARGLAAGFGLDAQPIEARMAWLHQLQQPTVAQAPKPAPTQPEDLNRKRGQDLLVNARQELRAGQLVTARRITEEAFSGPYGVQAEAADLLRSIEVEEHNQVALRNEELVRSAIDAARRKEYNLAVNLARQVDADTLTPQMRSRLRELMQTPEMVQVAPAPAPTTPPPGGVTPAVAVAPPLPAANNGFAQEVQAMQDVKFQQMREQGLQVQGQATTRFQAGSSDQAIDMLQEYLVQVDDSRLDPAMADRLKKPIEVRLQQFKALKAKRDLADERVMATKTGFDREKKRTAAEEQKQRQLSELFKQYEQLSKECKYKDAILVAEKAAELDPDNSAVDLMVNTARMRANVARAEKAKKSREDIFLESLDDVEDQGPVVGDHHPVAIDPERYHVAKARQNTSHIDMHEMTPKERDVEHRLDNPVSLAFKETPLCSAIDYLRGYVGVNIILDRPALEDLGIKETAPVTLKLENVKLRTALDLVLRNVDVHLTWIVKDEVVQVTSDKNAKGKLMQRTYNVADIIIPVDNYIVSPTAQLMNQLSQGPNNVHLNGGMPFTQPANSLQGGQTVGAPAGTSQNPLPGTNVMTSVSDGNPPAGTRAPGQRDTMQAQLIALIKNTISPSSWSDVGGPGTIDYFPLGMALVINQTLDIQEQVQQLLDALRKLQDLEVAVEVRMIDLEEAFFERIGIDFNVSIDPKVAPSVQSQIVSQQFAAPTQVNSPTFQHVFYGLTPAGAPTSDLHIPITSSSFGQAIPPFGGYPNIPGADGGLSLGLAFLSDIQVYMFMEAAQGDRRTNVMQAPKLTLFNGQTATIQIQDFQYFVTNVQVVQQNGQVVFVPQNQPIPLGVNLAVQAVVSADRRFVRLNLAPTLTNLASATVPLFPITTFITPVFEGGAQGQPVPFTQFIQQPTFTTVTIQTTVSVPDGGTVLLGGLKLLNEGRNEFGPPVLSKIPYINRLFKNVGYGRDTSSLLLMVTPRIIINAEEERTQVPDAEVPGT